MTTTETLPPAPTLADDPLRVAVLSSYALVRAGLTGLIRSASGRAVVVDTDGQDGRALDVVVYDLAGLSRGAADGDLRRLLTGSVPLVGWVREGHEDLERGAHNLGVRVTVPEQVSATALLDALELSASHRPRLRSRQESRTLSGRERLILSLVGAGQSNREIAADLAISINSVKTYIRTAYRKIGVQTRPQAVLWAIRHGLLPSTD